MQVIQKNKKIKRILFGIEPSGNIHLGHYLNLKSLIDLKKQDPSRQVYILLADTHARLNLKSDVSENLKRSIYFFKKVMPFCKIVLASKLIGYSGYWKLFLNFSKKVSIKETCKGLPRVFKDNSLFFKSPLSYGIYAVMQAIDSHFLNIDTVLGGLDQRKTYMMMYDIYKKLGWPKPNLILNPLLSMNGTICKLEEKMSSSGKNIPLDLRLLNLIKTFFNNSQFKKGLFEKSFLKFYLQEETLKIYKEKNIISFLQNLKNFLELLVS